MCLPECYAKPSCVDACKEENCCCRKVTCTCCLCTKREPRWRCIVKAIIVGYFVAIVLFAFTVPVMGYPGAFMGGFLGKEKDEYGTIGEEITFSSRNGHSMKAFYRTYGSGPTNATLLFYGGNMQSMWLSVYEGADLLSNAENSTNYTYHIYSFSYRGYNPNPGGPFPYGDMFEHTIIEDALGLHDHAVAQTENNNFTAIVGHSLGTAVSTAVTKSLGSQASCLMLGCPFTTARKIGVELSKGFGVPWLYMIWDTWQTKPRIEEMSLPLMVLSSVDDEVIPSFMHKQVYEAASTPADRKMFRESPLTHAPSHEHFPLHAADISTWLGWCKDRGLP